MGTNGWNDAATTVPPCAEELSLLMDCPLLLLRGEKGCSPDTWCHGEAEDSKIGVARPASPAEPCTTSREEEEVVSKQTPGAGEPSNGSPRRQEMV
jgi:hypothetical protein